MLPAQNHHPKYRTLEEIRQRKDELLDQMQAENKQISAKWNQLFVKQEDSSKGEYIASRKKLRRWQWLKTPTPEDADLLKAFAQAHDAGDFNRDAYEDFLERLALEEFIKMEILA